MNVDELYRLAIWFEALFPETDRHYRELVDPLNHNANQPNKQPLEGPLQALIDFLDAQRFDELSIQQLKMLSLLGVDAYLGHAGAVLVDDVVRTANYDPATALAAINAAISKLKATRNSFKGYAEAVKTLGYDPQDIEPDDGRIIIRVGFQNDVSIDNIADWKDSGKEWYEIVRGIAMACDEKPEDVKVVGAATGSIILILAATVTFSMLMARISKNITSVAMDIINIRSAMEDLRHKGMLNRAMEAEFKLMEKTKKDDAIKTIENVLEEQLKGKNGEIKAGLTKSIEKLLTFSEKGGTVDFVAPEGDEADDVADDDVRAALIEARDEIREYQSQLHTLKLITAENPQPPE